MTLAYRLRLPLAAVDRRLPLAAALATCLSLVVAADGAYAEPIVRRDTVGTVGLAATGNTLGLAGNEDGPAATDRIGAFTDADGVLQVEGWPLGTTLDWRLASSEAELDLPDDAVVDYAELVWAGSLDADVLAEADAAIRFTTPDGAHDVVPDEATAAVFADTQFGTGYYARSADVTALVAGAGRYRVGAVPAALDDGDSAAGWTLYVVYRAPSEPLRHVVLATVMAFAERGVDASALTFTIDGACAAPDATGRVIASAIDGDPNINGDSLRIAADEAGLERDDTRASGPVSNPDNLYGGRITKADGTLDTRGTFGGDNNGPSIMSAGARQGWDLANLPAVALAQGETLLVRGSTGNDSYGLLAVAVAMPVLVPQLADDGDVLSRAPAGAVPIGEVTFSVVLDNVGTGIADDLTFALPTPPAGIRYVANSLARDGAAPPNGPVADAAALAAGVPLGELGAGDEAVVTLRLTFGTSDQLGGVDTYVFAPRVTYASSGCGTTLEPFAPDGLVVDIARASCGDGVVADGFEACDDGDLQGGDGCDRDCQVEPGWLCVPDDGRSACDEDCGDGRIVGDEVCDDGAEQGELADGCSATCRTVDHGWACLGEPSQCRARCGDGVLAEDFEACDDGNRDSGDGCSASCGAIETGWSCDDEPSECETRCGDGFVRRNEQCDDGNAASGDGCDTRCRVEATWQCAAPDEDAASVCGKDRDQDGVLDAEDNCPDVANPDQDFPPDSIDCPVFDGPRTRGGGGCAGGPGGDTIVMLLSALGALGLRALARRRRRGAVGAGAVVTIVGAIVGVLAGASGAGAPARAQEVDPRVFEPTLSPLGVLGVETSLTARHLTPWVNLVATFADDELITRTGESRLSEGPLADRFMLTFGAGFGLFDRVDIAIGFPVAVAATLEPGGVSDADMGMTDLRLFARGKIFGPGFGGAGPGLALALHVTAPTGSDTPFMSDGGATVMPQLIVDYRSDEGHVVALNVGFRIRPERTVDDLVIGNELRLGLGAELPVGFYGFAFTGELDCALSLAESPHDKGGIAEREAPLEVMGGMRWRSDLGVTVSGAVGSGLTAGYGAPDFRVLLGLAFNVPAPDRFEEPIVPASKNERRDDWKSDRPVERGRRGPPLSAERFDQLAAMDPDGDSDGVPVPADVCPTVPEDRDGHADDDGCLDPDNDGDGVFDEDDKCPDEQETLNGNEDFDGCYDEPKPVEGQGIKDNRIEIHDRILFKPGSAELLDSDKVVLDQVAVVMRANPNVKRFRIEGHTDNLGDKEFNVDLAERRAWSVRDYLIEKGIDEQRLFPKGFGSTRPLAKNNNDANRSKNRRVEFHIIREGEPSEGNVP